MRDLDAQLARLHASHLYRSRTRLEGPQGAEVDIDGKTYLSFCSNDYLGLARDARLIAALQQGAACYGVGSGASHLVTGHQRPHHELEERLAAFTKRPRALLFANGYMANLGTLASLLGRGDTVFEDRLNHASLLDAGLLSGAYLKRYAHADADALQAQLAANPRPALIATDGVFSMDGDLAPLPRLAAVATQAGARLMVDDAHGLGVLGVQGRGSLEHYGLDMRTVPILMGTLGKAFGTYGAFVAGSETLIETLIQRARTYIYTTALPAAIAYATLESLRIVEAEPWRRDHLQLLIRRFRDGAERLGLPLLASSSPIQALLVGDPQAALALSASLRTRGIYVVPIRPPTVPAGTARLRISLSAAHTAAHIDRLLEALMMDNLVRRHDDT